MKQNLLQSLAQRLRRTEASEQGGAIDQAVSSRLNAVLDEHLDKIAAAHNSVHGNHHGSTPNKNFLDQ
jgi:hypothetical protein